MTGLEGIIEIEEVGNRRANYLLSLGYRFLAIGEKSWETGRRQTPPGSPTTQTYVRRDLRYSIGRTADMPAFPAWGSERDDSPASA